jgi:uncharacterized phage-associated protein
MARNEARPLTPLELIKLSYIAHGWSLALLDRPLVNEAAEAWQYGPVFPDLYHRLKNYRANPVTDVPPGGTELFGPVEISSEDQALIKSVFDAYKGLNAIQLSSLTHQTNTPWDITFRKGRNKVIDNDLIKRHFNDIRDKRAA